MTSRRPRPVTDPTRPAPATAVQHDVPQHDVPRRVAAWLGLRLMATSMLEVLLACAVVVAAVLVLLGVGVFLLPPAAAALHRLAAQARRDARDRAGVEVDEPEPWPSPPTGAGFAALLRHCLVLLAQPALWREVTWGMLHLVPGAVLGVLPGALLLSGLFEVLVRPLVWQHLDIEDSGLAVGVPADSWPWIVARVVMGAGVAAAAWLLGPAALRADARATGALLRPGRADRRMAELSRRALALTASRADAVDAHALELRRIERDLHDGAQARLVATGMSLARAEHLLAHDPEAARSLLAEARSVNAGALKDLRDLVRGIHPPVLADRGLADALRALALDSDLDVEVRADLPGRAPLPVESALYFAVAELLANAAKHSGARQVWIEATGGPTGATGDGDRLRVSVRDDGRGGADPALGTGLQGLHRRLAAFDGTLVVSSPPGGPTVIRMEVPCAFSSPRTTS